MKLESLAALLISLFLMCISVPILFAEESDPPTQLGNSYINQDQNNFIDQTKDDKKEVSTLSELQDRYYLGSAGLTKYGVDLISLSGSGITSSNVKFRTGFNGFSKNAAAGVQLIVSW